MLNVISIAFVFCFNCALFCYVAIGDYRNENYTHTHSFFCRITLELYFVPNGN